MKTLVQKYKHAWLLLYMGIYFVWFFWLEQRNNLSMTTIHMTMDEWIPFNEFFFIPYAMWFLYIPAVVLYYLFHSKSDYYKTCAFLFSGMTICLIIYTIWPNCQDLRPSAFARDNFLVDAVRNLYLTDTATNVCPSIHVFNSIGAYIAINENEKLHNNKLIRFGALILTVLICLSTVFLKQHSVFDGLCAVALSCVLYLVVYRVDYTALRIRRSERKRITFDKNGI